jgi:hypothetical protein
MQAGAAQQSIVHHSAKGCTCGQLVGDGAAYNREDIRHREATLREEPISGAPILKLRTGSGEQASHGVASETKQRTQCEGFRPGGDAALVEGGET